MLRTRILTAAVLLPLAVALVWFLPPGGFFLAWGVVILLGAWEWTSLIAQPTPAARLGFTALVGGMLYAMFLAQTEWLGPVVDQWLVFPVALFWLVVGLLCRSRAEWLVSLRPPAALRALVGALVLTFAWSLLCSLRANFGVVPVLYLLALVWLADSAAYFAGRRFGRNKLAPVISPGKTIEGLDGALLSGVLLSVAVSFWLGPFFESEPTLNVTKLIDFAVLTLVTVLFSVAGDLFESLMKRWSDVKDSGGLLPGHGGVLDRIDSLLAAAPIFYAGLLGRMLL